MPIFEGSVQMIRVLTQPDLLLSRSMHRRFQGHSQNRTAVPLLGNVLLPLVQSNHQHVFNSNKYVKPSSR